MRTGTPFLCAALIQPGGGMVTRWWLKYTNVSTQCQALSRYASVGAIREGLGNTRKRRQRSDNRPWQAMRS